MYYYFKNAVHRNVHIYKHDLEPEYKGKYIIAFQTNWSNTWYYLNRQVTIGKMTQATKASRFETQEEAYAFMNEIFKTLEFQGIEQIKA